MMKLSDIKRDVAAVEQGQWIGDIPEMGDLRLNVRGADNTDWRRIEAKMLAALSPQDRAAYRTDADIQDRITSACLLGAGLLGWEGQFMTDEANAVIPFSAELAGDLVTRPEWRKFRNAVLWAVNQVGAIRVANAKADAKN